MESFATGDGRSLSFRREGSGPVLICHPGGPGFSSRYFGDLAGLGAERTLVLLNPRGTEGSDAPQDPRGFATEDYVADLEGLRQHLALETIDLLGHSHGGVVAQAYAAAYPAHIRKLVVASSLARFDAGKVEAMEASMAAKSGEPWYDDAKAALEQEQAGDFSSSEELAELALREFPFYFAEYGPRERAYLETLRGELPNADALRFFNDQVFTTFDLRADLALVDAETLVITGADDFITGPECASDISGAVAGAETVILPDCGHFIFVEQPDRFRAAVLEFLER